MLVSHLDYKNYSEGLPLEVLTANYFVWLSVFFFKNKMSDPEKPPSTDSENKNSSPQEGVDFYLVDGAMVFTEAYHLKRGYCCECGCRHCPFEITKKPS